MSGQDPIGPGTGNSGLWAFFSPFSGEFKQAEEIFHKELTWDKKALVVIASMVGALFFIVGAFPLFRWTANALKPGENTSADKVDTLKGEYFPVGGKTGDGSSNSRKVEEEGKKTAKVDTLKGNYFPVGGKTGDDSINSRKVEGEGKKTAATPKPPEVKLETVEERKPIIFYSRGFNKKFPNVLLPEDFPKANYYMMFSSNDRPSPLQEEYKNFESQCDPQLPKIIIGVMMSSKIPTMVDYLPKQGAPVVRLGMSVNPDEKERKLVVDNGAYDSAVKGIKGIIDKWKGSHFSDEAKKGEELRELGRVGEEGKKIVPAVKPTEVKERPIDEQKSIIYYASGFNASYPNVLLPEDFPKANYYVMFSSQDLPHPRSLDFADFKSQSDPHFPKIILAVRMTDGHITDKIEYGSEPLTAGIPILLLRMGMEAQNIRKLVIDEAYHSALKNIRTILENYHFS